MTRTELTRLFIVVAYRAELTTGAPNIRLQLGMFTVYPAVGTVPAGGSVQVTVDMIGENPGFSEEVSVQNWLDAMGHFRLIYKCVMDSISRAKKSCVFAFIMHKLTGTRLTRLQLDFDWPFMELAFDWLSMSSCDQRPIRMPGSFPHFSH